MFYFIVDWEGIRGGFIKVDGVLYVFVEGGDEGEEFWWVVDFLKDLEEFITID